MAPRCAWAGVVLATSLFVGSAAAENSAADLERVAEQNLAQERLTDAVSPYFIAPRLVQLRRYVDPGRHVKWVCVLDLALSNQQGVVLATVRGSAATTGASRDEAVDAAMHAAVLRLPVVLQTLPEHPSAHVAQQ